MGPTSPCQFCTSTAGYPASAMVGRSGNSGERTLLVIASARSLPPLIEGIAAYICSNMNWTWPPMRSVAPAEPLLYGTWIMSRPATLENSAALM